MLKTKAVNIQTLSFPNYFTAIILLLLMILRIYYCITSYSKV